MLKTKITGYSALFLILNYGVYLFVLANHKFNSQWIASDWGILIIAFMVLLTWLLCDAETFLQESILNGLKLLLCLICVNVMLTKCGVIKDPYTNLILFLSGSSISISILLYELMPKTYKKITLWITASLISAIAFGSSVVCLGRLILKWL